MSSAVAGYKQRLGADAPPACYDDIDAGAHACSSPARTRPGRTRCCSAGIEDARAANPAQKWIVVDPRRTETAAQADLHLQLQPGTDVVLYHAMLHLMLWEGLSRRRLHRRAHRPASKRCAIACASSRRRMPPRSAASRPRTSCRRRAGSPASIGQVRLPTLSLYCQGLNQSSSGTDKNSTLINLHLATGQIGKPGAGPLSLTGQPNAMGGREVGGLANLLSRHTAIWPMPQHRAEVAALWGVAGRAGQPGKTRSGDVPGRGRRRRSRRCGSPAPTRRSRCPTRRWCAARCSAASSSCCRKPMPTPPPRPTPTCCCRPASWGEKDGTVTNSERRISRVRAAVPPPGEARDDWAIGVAVAQRLEARLPRRAKASMFPYTTPEQVWNEHRELTRGRDLDITGLSYAKLDTPQHWPFAQAAVAGTARLYADGRFPTADGRARFVAPAWRAVAEPRDARHPIALTTGRHRDQWHGMSRTGTLGRLFAHAGEPAVELHPQELHRRRLNDGDLVRISSRRGALVLPARASDTLMPAQAFIAMHWGSEFVGGNGVNALTSPATCPQSMQPELKHAAVRVEPAALPWAIAAALWQPAAQAQATRERLRGLFGRFAFASCVPFGREPGAQLGLRFRAALAAPADDSLLAEVEAALGLSDGPVLRYADARNGQRRTLALDDDGWLARLHAGRRRRRRRLGAAPAAAAPAGGRVRPCAAGGQPPAAAAGGACAARRSAPATMSARRASSMHCAAPRATTRSAWRPCSRACAAAPNAAPACRR